MKIRNRRKDDEMVSAQRTPYGVAILLELNRSGRHIYEGTVSAAERAARRRKNKAARQARAKARR